MKVGDLKGQIGAGEEDTVVEVMEAGGGTWVRGLELKGSDGDSTVELEERTLEELGWRGVVWVWVER